MPLSAKKLQIFQKYYKIVVRPIREFDNGMGHPVVMMRECHAGASRKKNSWMHLMCPCDLKWRWEMLGTPKKRMMIMTGDSFNCPAKKDARAVVRSEIRTKYHSAWAAMSLADAAYDIWKRSCAGEYLGEFDVGTLYAQDVEELLGTAPEVMNIHLGAKVNAQGEVVGSPEVVRCSFPSRTILAALGELKQRKRIDLNGMILVPYKESFRFPESLHHQFAHWIEEPLGWPNGDAGDCFMFALYRKIVTYHLSVTGYSWYCGEEVFGDANIPNLTPTWATHVPKWMTNLDALLTDEKVQNKSEVLEEITPAQWVEWLYSIAAEIESRAEG